MSAIVDCTLPEKILLAAHQLEEQGQSPFSAEALIVGAWQKYPRTFGLKSFEEQYPDSNKVLASIMGERGLIRRGWLVKVGQKLYTLTRDGRQVVRRLLHGELPLPSGPEVCLARDQDKLLLALFAATAYDKFRDGRQQELTFADACRFWSITENLSGQALDDRLEQLQSSLAQIEKEIGLGSTTLSNGRSVSSEDLALLFRIHGHLEQRFQRHLNLLRSRAGRH